MLIGVDHFFEAKGEPHKVVTSNGADPDHFDPDYFGRGFKWQLPDLDSAYVCYETSLKLEPDYKQAKESLKALKKKTNR